MRKITTLAIAGLLCICGCATRHKTFPTIPPSRYTGTVLVEKGDLLVLFKDNSQSPGVLSGIQSLFNVKAAKDFDAYDPDTQNASAGMNFEHIISGHRDRNNFFTPRRGRYRLIELPAEDSVMLVRNVIDSPWKIESTLKYTLVEPHYIDMEFNCTAHDPSLFGDRGYAVMFFANYMNDVIDPAIYFRGVESPDRAETWIAADGPKGHRHFNGGGTYHHIDAPTLEYDEDNNAALNLWSYDWPRFTKPFYYGRADNGMVFMLMADRDYSERDEIRFSLFKFKLDKFPRPAWDMQYVIHKVRRGERYGFKARLVWKKFVSEADCLAEYQRWQGSLKSAR